MVNIYDVNNNFCVAPFIHLNIGPREWISPCCVYEGIVGSSFDGILNTWHSQEINTLRKAFLNNERPVECRNCWAVEDAGGLSYRHKVNQDNLPHINLRRPLLKPIWLQLKLGAKCNLACRTCDADSSHKLLKQTLYSTFGKINKDWIREKQKRSSWIYDNSFWDELKDISENLELLTLTGGEPLINDEHYTYLEWCIDQGYAKNIRLDYITNGTVKLDNYKKELWKNFRHVNIDISLDGTGKLAEYIRTGIEWDAISKNILEYKKEYNASISWLISIYNVRYVDQIFSFCDEHDIFLTLNPLHTPIWQNVKTLPNSVKKIIIEHIEQIVTKKPKQFLIDFVKQSIDEDFTFCTMIKQQEEWHKKATREILDYEKLFPEWWSILNERQ